MINDVLKNQHEFYTDTMKQVTGGPKLIKVDNDPNTSKSHYSRCFKTHGKVL